RPWRARRTVLHDGSGARFSLGCQVHSTAPPGAQRCPEAAVFPERVLTRGPAEAARVLREAEPRRSRQSARSRADQPLDPLLRKGLRLIGNERLLVLGVARVIDEIVELGTRLH